MTALVRLAVTVLGDGPLPRASESMVPPAVALATIAENAAPERPSAKIVDPTGPAMGSKILARPKCCCFGIFAAQDGGATMMTSEVMIPGATMPGMVSAMLVWRYWLRCADVRGFRRT